MRGLFYLLLLIAGLAGGLGALERPQPAEEVLGYWLEADGRVTEFTRTADGAPAVRIKHLP